MAKPATPLPCPLCGSAVVEIPNGFKHASSEHDDAIENCPLAGMSWSRSFYLPAWNRRVPDLTAINAELVEALEALMHGMDDLDILANAEAFDRVKAALDRAKENSNGH